MAEHKSVSKYRECTRVARWWCISVGSLVTLSSSGCLKIFNLATLVCPSHSSNPLELCSDHFTNRLCWQRVFYKDPTVWLDGARPPPMSLITADTFVHSTRWEKSLTSCKINLVDVNK
jgi:hypothetical protein